MLLLLLFMLYLAETRNVLEISVNTKVARASLSAWRAIQDEKTKGLLISVLHTTVKSMCFLGVFSTESKANVGTKRWRSIYRRTSMERADKTTIFPGDVSLGVIF